MHRQLAAAAIFSPSPHCWPSSLIHRPLTAMEEGHASAPSATFASLPLPLAQRIFLALPAGARGRAACVCRAWRDVLADPELWTRLNLRRADGIDDRLNTSTLLQGAAGRARGKLRSLITAHAHPTGVLLAVLAANARSLRTLHTSLGNTRPLTTVVQEIVTAAPRLKLLKAGGVMCEWEEAARMMRGEPPFAPLQVRRLHVQFGDNELGGVERFGPFAAALADVTRHPALSELEVWHADTKQPASLGALVDAALARRLRRIGFDNCAPLAAAPLARLLAGGWLTYLNITVTVDEHESLLDSAGAALVADALRANTTLTELYLYKVDLCLDVHAAELVLGALVGHPRLHKLTLNGEDPDDDDDAGALGAALAALVAADAPALQCLDCACNRLGDAGLAPLVDALPRNRHLRELHMHANEISEALAERLVRANTGLRGLHCAEDDDTWPAGAEAEDLVNSRAPHG